MRRIILMAALVSALGCIRIAANPEVRRPVKQFIHYYRQQEPSMGFLPRAVYSWMLAERAS
jgi:hypothetical protein